MGWLTWGSVSGLDLTPLGGAGPPAFPGLQTVNAKGADMELLPHQHAGVTHLVKRRTAYLADDMGLGKTVQAIVAARTVGAQRIAVISPASMVETWRLEFSTWWDSPDSCDLYIVSYDKLVRSALTRRGLEEFKPNVVICDEAHYMKNLEAKRTKRVLTASWFVDADYTWFLSGTPTPNGPHELYSIVRHVMPERLKQLGVHSYVQWINLFCKWWSGDYGPVITGAKNVPLLRELLFTNFMFRRRFEEVEASLPTVDLRLFPIRHKDEVLTMLEDLVDSDEILAALESQSPLPDEGGHIATLRKETGKIKADIMGKILAEELKEGTHKLVVFAYHLDAINTLNTALAKYNPVVITGSTPTESRARIVQKFQTEPNTRVFIGQIVAAGVGITLTAAKDVVIVEPSWVPSENAQAIGRVRRIGQTSATVYARMPVLRGSLDEAIVGTLRRKQQTISQTIDGTEEPS